MIQEISSPSTPYYAIKNSPADFLSAIFGIYGKFWIDIGVQKKIRRKFSKTKWMDKSGQQNQELSSQLQIGTPMST